jgi:HipA-like protein
MSEPRKFDRIRGIWKKGNSISPVVNPGQSTFNLFLRGMEVGELTYDSTTWRFRYSDSFKSKPSLRPIAGFPDPEKEYSSTELWPFFAMRIPSLEQSAVKRAIRRDALNEASQVDLLGRFGRKTISSPFELRIDEKRHVIA